jgi:hypothetical protein
MTPADGISVKLWLFELSGSGSLGVKAVLMLAALLIIARFLKPPDGKL